MTIYIKSINRNVWKVMDIKIEIDDEEAPTAAEEMLLQNNNITLIAIHDALDERTFEQIKNIERAHKTCVGVSDRGVLNQPVNVNCVPLIPDGDAKRNKVYTGSGNRRPTSSLGDRSCILCTKVLVVGVYKLGERGS